MNEMKFVEQRPDLCAYACLESIFLDKGLRFDQIQLFNSVCANKKSSSNNDEYQINLALKKNINLLETYDKLNEIFYGFYIQKDAYLSTQELLEKYSNQEIIIIILRNSQGNKLPWPNHALRIKKIENKILVMDPYLKNDYSVFTSPYNRRDDNLIEVNASILDVMRLDNKFIEFFII